MSARTPWARQRLSVGGWLYDIRWRIISAVLNRIATDEMRHAALLLGFDFGDGYGRERFLGHLHEFTVGCEISAAVRLGGGAEICRALEAYNLERAVLGGCRHAFRGES